MLYHITRGGQSYGPYTLADLQRYVASGHVLPTDLAKSDVMAEWVAVSQILSPSGLPPAGQLIEPGGYIPPQPGYVQPLTSNAYPGPPDLHWAILLVINILFSPFQIIWNFIVAFWLKKIQPTSRAWLYYAIGYGILLVTCVLLVSFVSVAPSHGQFTLYALLSVALLGSWILRILARFNVKSSLEDHFNTVEPINFQMSGVLTFFFGGLYIQSQLNRINEIKQAVRYRDFGR